MLGRIQRVSGNFDTLLLQIRSLTKETILYLGAECPALLGPVSHPYHILYLHEMLTLLSFPQLFWVTLHSVLNYFVLLFTLSITCIFSLYSRLNYK